MSTKKSQYHMEYAFLRIEAIVIEESDLYKKKKHSEQRISTLRGIALDSSHQDENRDISIFLNRKFVSNEIDENEEHH
jgi:hypothetical protein